MNVVSGAFRWKITVESLGVSIAPWARSGFLVSPLLRSASNDDAAFGSLITIERWKEYFTSEATIGSPLEYLMPVFSTHLTVCGLVYAHDFAAYGVGLVEFGW